MYYDVLFHADADLDTFGMALRNAKNYIQALSDENFAVALVVNGAAITHVTRAKCVHAELIAELARQKMTLYACRNSMNDHGLSDDDLIAEAVIVPAGVVHIVKLQRDGFAYIKP